MEPDKVKRNSYIVQKFTLGSELTPAGVKVFIQVPLNKFKAYISPRLVRKLKNAKLPVEVKVRSVYFKTKTMGTVVRHTITEVVDWNPHSDWTQQEITGEWIIIQNGMKRNDGNYGGLEGTQTYHILN